MSDNFFGVYVEGKSHELLPHSPSHFLKDILKKMCEYIEKLLSIETPSDEEKHKFKILILKSYPKFKRFHTAINSIYGGTTSVLRCTTSEFADVLSNKTIPEKIIWYGSQKELAFIFHCLIENGIISRGCWAETVTERFILQTGRSLKEGSLTSEKKKFSSPNKTGDVSKIIDSKKRELLVIALS